MKIALDQKPAVERKGNASDNAEQIRMRKKNVPDMVNQHRGHSNKLQHDGITFNFGFRAERLGYLLQLMGSDLLGQLSGYLSDNMK